jgi:TetR/AcrR family transcriptional repressor of nem operon
MSNESPVSVKSSTREHILDAARDLIQTRSYLGFSFQDVADQVGIRKPSMYHHFSSKEALGVAVIRESIQGFRNWTGAKTRTPEASLSRYFSMYRNALHASEAVCPAGAIAPGWGCINDDLRQAVRDLRDTQVLWLTDVLRALNANDGSSSAEVLAGYVFAVCQGASLSARMTGRVEDFDDAVSELKHSLFKVHQSRTPHG